MTRSRVVQVPRCTGAGPAMAVLSLKCLHSPYGPRINADYAGSPIPCDAPIDSNPPTPSP